MQCGCLKQRSNMIMELSESEKKPLCITSGSSEIARNYRALAKEIEKRIEEERGI